MNGTHTRTHTHTHTHTGAGAVVSGIIGTIGGGLLLDSLVKLLKKETQEASLLLAVVLMLVAWPLIVLALQAGSYKEFMIYMFVGQLFAFATTSPVNGVLLWCAPPCPRVSPWCVSPWVNYSHE